MRAERRLALDVLWLGVGVLLGLAAVIVLVDGVEQAHALAIGETGWTGWLQAVAARVPEDLAGAAPVAAALAGALAGRRWLSAGAAAALSGLGRSPVRLAGAAGVGGLLVVALAGGLREAAAPWAAGRAAADGGWAALPAAGGTLYLHAGHWVGDTAVDVTAALRTGGVLRAVGHARRLRWDGRAWVPGPSGWRGTAPVLPDPGTWRRWAAQAGPRASVASLWAAPAGASRSAWLWERAAFPVGGGLLALVAFAWGLRAPASAVPGALGISLAWSLGTSGAFAVAARGGWPATGAALVVLASAAGLAAAASLVVHRGVLARDEQEG